MSNEIDFRHLLDRLYYKEILDKDVLTNAIESLIRERDELKKQRDGYKDLMTSARIMWCKCYSYIRKDRGHNEDPRSIALELFKEVEAERLFPNKETKE